jgi:hypothetical protein
MADEFFLLYFTTGVGLFGQLCLLYLQVRAYFRNRHNSFAILAASTVLGLVYLVAVFAPYFSASLARLYHVSAWVAAGALALQLALGVWGAAWLFSSYGTLAQRRGT